MAIIFNTLGILLSMIGTLLTLWSVLTAKVSVVGTWGELEHRSVAFIKEHKQVLAGTIFIVLGALLQIIGQFA